MPASPLLSIDPAATLSVTLVGDAVKGYCEEIFSTFLVGDGVNIVIEGFTLATTDSDVVYRFSERAMKLCREGNAEIAVHAPSGKYLPFIQDKAGRIIEQAKGSSSVVPRLAEIAAIVVSAAHIISGIDLSRRMVELQKGVDYLVAQTMIEKEAHLQRLFSEARSLLQRTPTELILDRLFTMRYDLAQLRGHLAGEISQELQATHRLPVRHGAHPTSWFLRGHREAQIVRDISRIERQQELASVALLIDSILALSTGTTQDFKNNVLPRDEAVWGKLDQTSHEVSVRFRRKQSSADFARAASRIGQHVILIRSLQGLGIDDLALAQ
jgi:hypothetical protein